MKKLNRVIRTQKATSDINRGVCIMDSITHAIFNNKFNYDDKEVEPLKNNNTRLKLKQIDTNISAELNYFDKAVYDAICGLVYNEVYNFTTAYVYRMMLGNTEAYSNINFSNIEESIYKLCNIIINLSCKTSEGEAGVYKFFISQHLLTLSQCRVILRNGKETDGWMITEEPALYKYARSIDKIECFKLELLKTSLAFTENNIKLTKYLFEEILKTKNGTQNNTRTVIKFPEIYQVVGIDKTDHSSKTAIKRKRILDKCEKIFNSWKNEAGILEKWGQVLDGNKKTGYRFKIDLNGFKVLIIDDWGDGDIDERYEDVVFEKKEKTRINLSGILGTENYKELFSFWMDNDVDNTWFTIK